MRVRKMVRAFVEGEYRMRGRLVARGGGGSVRWVGSAAGSVTSILGRGHPRVALTEAASGRLAALAEFRVGQSSL